MTDKNYKSLKEMFEDNQSLLSELSTRKKTVKIEVNELGWHLFQYTAFLAGLNQKDRNRKISELIVLAVHEFQMNNADYLPQRITEDLCSMQDDIDFILGRMMRLELGLPEMAYDYKSEENPMPSLD